VTIAGVPQPAGNAREAAASGGAVLWQEVECGGYTADLPLWEELAAEAGGGILELGCGIGRVALHLARQGHDVWGVDTDHTLIEALGAKAAAERLPVRAVAADARELSLSRRFVLIVAPMQLFQLLGGPSGRAAALEKARAHLAAGGRLAAAVVDAPQSALTGPVAPLPDIRELGGWVYSSLPVGNVERGSRIAVRRLRQAVAPSGELSEEEHAEMLDPLAVEALEAEARAAGFTPSGRREVPPDDGHIGSTVAIVEAA
jgi:SAM-dependent methyltransferase